LPDCSGAYVVSGFTQLFLGSVFLFLLP